MKKYLRLRELADYMGVSKRTVRNWCRNGLPKYRVPGSSLIYFDTGDLEKFFVRVNAKEDTGKKISAMVEDIMRKLKNEEE